MPIKGPISGWWLEYYFFYVKLRDMDARESIEDLLLNVNYDASALKTGVASAHWMEDVGTIPWVRMATKRIVEEYFRDENEVWNDRRDDTVGGLPLAKHGLKNYMESLFRSDELPDSSVPVTGTPDGIDMNDFDVLYHKWIFAKAQKITDMDFEDYLASFGVNSARVHRDRPELIRYVKEWKYPSNTIDSATGEPSSAVSWSIAERADKDRYFLEPGFVIGLTIARPKLYLEISMPNGLGLLDTAMSWLPAMMAGAPQMSLREYAENTGPLRSLYPTGGAAHGYVVDIRDLFVYGDVAHKNVPSGLQSYAPRGYLASDPTHNLSQYYDQSYIKDIFVDDTNPYIVQDGVVSMTVLGAQVDHT